MRSSRTRSRVPFVHSNVFMPAHRYDSVVAKSLECVDSGVAGAEFESESVGMLDFDQGWVDRWTTIAETLAGSGSASESPIITGFDWTRNTGEIHES